jgi:hypothetical protein
MRENSGCLVVHPYANYTYNTTLTPGLGGWVLAKQRKLAILAHVSP